MSVRLFIIFNFISAVWRNSALTWITNVRGYPNGKCSIEYWISLKWKSRKSTETNNSNRFGHFSRTPFENWLIFSLNVSDSSRFSEKHLIYINRFCVYPFAMEIIIHQSIRNCFCVIFEVSIVLFLVRFCSFIPFFFSSL